MRGFNEAARSRAEAGEHATDDAAAALLNAVGRRASLLHPEAKQTLIMQGQSAAAVYYIMTGKVQLSVVSTEGKEAVTAILGGGDFFGEGSVAGQASYPSSAVTITPCTIVRIERSAMATVLQEQPAVSQAFMTFLLSRSGRIEADLLDQLFNSSERRLARTLLLLANVGTDATNEVMIPRISQEVLAAKVGTTRSRINFFMNKFRKLGFVEYQASGMLKVNPSLLQNVLRACAARRPASGAESPH